MPIDYTSTTGSLQLRLGKQLSLGADLRAQQGSTLVNIEEVRGQYTATTIDRAEWVGTLLSVDAESHVDAMGRPIHFAIREGVERTILESVNDGIRQVPDVDTALRVLAVNMIEQTQSIGTTNISISAVTNSATGSGSMILSSAGKYVYGGAKYAAKQAQNDSIIPETLNARCVKDARDGSLVRGNERWMIEGQAGVERLDRRWQTTGYGSGATLMLNSTCGSIENSSERGQNMLSNSGFERDDGTSPLDWLIQTGTAGTTVRVRQEPARGTQALRLTGNDSILHNVYQRMGQGPRPNIKANTVYIVSAYLKGVLGGGAVNTGTIAFQLRDDSNNEISGCSVARNMAGSGLSVPDDVWTHVTGSFTTPLNLPPVIRFAIAFTVKLGNQDLLVDEVVLTEAQYVYPGGPAVAVVAGTSDWELDDRMAASIAKTANVWQLNLDRYLDLAGRGIQFPVSASPTFVSTHIA